MEGGVLATKNVDRAMEVLQQIEAAGHSTVRLSFPDQHGLLRGKAIAAQALFSAFRNGITVPSTLLLKDLSHRTVFPVWTRDAGFGANALTGAGDIVLIPDPETYRTIPWAPGTGWMMCDVAQSDGEEISFASRNVLRRAIAQLQEQGFSLTVGLEVEFHIFEVEDAPLTHEATGMPGVPPATRPLMRNYELLSEARYDANAEILDVLREHCEKLEMSVRSVEAEFGPSQFEFVFEPGEALAQADAMVLFRSMVKQVCHRRGLHATFMSRPKVANGSASGWHIHQSLIEHRTGQNAFVPEIDRPDGLTAVASQWIGGLLAHARESCLITTPTVNGYRRYQTHQLAPDRVQWGRDNKGAMIRALMRPGDPASRIENRVPEPAANPHYVLASQILSGLSGLRSEMTAPPPVEEPYDSDAEPLPASLLDALQAFEGGKLYASALGEDFARYYATLKRAEWDRYIATLSEWEQAEYFGVL